MTTEREHQKELKQMEKEGKRLEDRARISKQKELDNLKEKMSKVSFDPVSVMSLSPLFI